MKMLKIGIIGAGNIGYYHACNIAQGKIDKAVLTAVCDIDADMRRRIAEKFDGVAVYEDYHELLGSGDCDAVIIATPHYLHPSIAIDALEAGLHVLSEKPAGVNVSEVEKLNSLAGQSKLVFSIMFNQRLNPVFRKAKEIISSGGIGKIKKAVWLITNWYRTQFYYDSGDWRATWSGEGGGVLLNQCPHNLDLLQWLIGMPDGVYADLSFGKWHDIEVEDEAQLIFDYANGAKAVFITSTGEPCGTNRLEITGTLGKLVLEGGIIKYWKFLSDERDYCFSATASFGSPEYEYTEITVNNEDMAHCGIIGNFVAAALHSEPLLISGTEGINELMLSNAAYLSAWTGKRVNIPFDTALFDKLLREKRDGEKKKKKRRHIGDCDASRWTVRW